MRMLLEKLRTHCHDAHEALHIHPFLLPLQGDLELSQYTSIIAMFHAAYQATEREKTFVEHLPNSPIMDWLQRDFERHGIIPLEWHAPCLPIGNESARAGYLYVKQGSCLGGQYISKKLHSGLRLEPGCDNYFFHGHGAGTGAMWRTFKEQLALAEDRLNADEVMESARMAFENIRLCADRMLRDSA